MSGTFKFLKAVWKSSIGNKIMLIAGALMFLIAGTVIPWAVITRHGDDGFLKAENGKALTLAEPLTCFYDDSVKAEALAVFESVRQECNTKIGREMIGPCVAWQLSTPLRPLVSGSVLLYVQEVPDDPTKPEEGHTRPEGEGYSHPGGHASLFFKKSESNVIVGAAVFIDPKYATSRPVWLHEIGHVLGLKHDRTKDSIMYPSIQERPGELSGKDAKLLKKHYGSEKS